MSNTFKELKKEYQTGKSKIDAFNKFCMQGGNPNRGAKYLAMYPDRCHYLKHKIMNNVLVGVSFLLVVLNYFGALMQTGAATLSIALLALLTIVFLFQVGIIYFMFKPNAIAYLLFILIMFIRALDSLVLVQIDPVSGWANLTLTGGILVFTIYMKITMFPFQNILHLREDQNGIRIFQSSPSC